MVEQSRQPEISEENPHRAGAAAAVARDAIDSGRGGDKVSGFDPAAAPLGTDEESAGNRPLTSSPAPAAPARPTAEKAADPVGNERARYDVQDRLLGPVLLGLAAVIVVAVLAAGFLTG